jgi:hypothetical protein
MSVDDTKHKIISFQLSDSEYSAVEQLSRRHGRGVSPYLLDGRRWHAPFPILANLSSIPM